MIPLEILIERLINIDCDVSFIKVKEGIICKLDNMAFSETFVAVGVDVKDAFLKAIEKLPKGISVKLLGELK